MDRYKTIWRLVQKHGYRFDYRELPDNIQPNDKVPIICPIHGRFYQRTGNHYYTLGCPYCSHKKKPTKEEFIEQAEAIHGKGRYIYTEVEYFNNKTEVTIICPIHGPFRQKPVKHLLGHGCPICGTISSNKNRSMTQEEFIARAIKIHGGYYSYEKVKYVNFTTKVIITCPIHGDFEMTPAAHLCCEQGCPACNRSKLELRLSRALNEIGLTDFESQKRFEWLKNKKNLRLDFYIPSLNLGVECQGKQHFEAYYRFGFEQGLNDCLERDLKKAECCQENGVELVYVLDRGLELKIQNDNIPDQIKGLYIPGKNAFGSIGKFKEWLMERIKETNR